MWGHTMLGERRADQGPAALQVGRGPVGPWHKHGPSATRTPPLPAACGPLSTGASARGVWGAEGVFLGLRPTL